MVEYPYIPAGRVIHYVPASDIFIEFAKRFAKNNSLDDAMPGAAVIVRDGVFLGAGANGSEYHKTNECQRKVLGCKTGEGYELCEGCHPKNHSEPSAILNAFESGYDTTGADLYLWGHWWCCEPCWKAMDEAGIRNVYLLEGSEILFNREVDGNIVGRQFAGMSN